MGREREVRKTTGNGADDSSYTEILGCSSTRGRTVLRAELGMHPLKTNRDARNLEWQHSVYNVPEKRLPAVVDRAVWEKGTKGRAGIR